MQFWIVNMFDPRFVKYSRMTVLFLKKFLNNSNNCWSLESNPTFWHDSQRGDYDKLFKLT